MAEREKTRSARGVLVLFLVLFATVMGLLYTSMHYIDADRAQTVEVNTPVEAP